MPIFPSSLTGSGQFLGKVTSAYRCSLINNALIFFTTELHVKLKLLLSDSQQPRTHNILAVQKHYYLPPTHTQTHTTSLLLRYYPYISALYISLHQRLLFLFLGLRVLITGLISLLLHIELQTITTHTNERFNLFVPFDKKIMFFCIQKVPMCKFKLTNTLFLRCFYY